VSQTQVDRKTCMGPVKFPRILLTISMNFLWNLAYFPNKCEIKHFPCEIGWSLLQPRPRPSDHDLTVMTMTTTYWRWPLIVTLVLFTSTLMPLFYTLSFHSLSLLIRSSSVSTITTRSSAYNNSHGKATLNSLDKASMTITNSKELNAEPWCVPTFTPKQLLLPQTVLTTV